MYSDNLLVANLFSGPQSNKHFLRVIFDSNQMRLVINATSGTNTDTTRNIIHGNDQVDNLFAYVFQGVRGADNDLYVLLTVDNIDVIDANFKHTDQAQITAKTLECANEIKQVISNRNLQRQVSHR